MVLLLSALVVPQASAARRARCRPGGEAPAQAPAGGPDGAAPSFKPPTFADDTVMYVFGPAYRNPFITTPVAA